MQSSHKLISLFSAITAVAFLGVTPSPVAAQTAAPTASRRSPLPDAALKLAQQAEQHLAANEPDKAIAILRDLDKQYPNQSAISLRLAEINDTLNHSGYALFYYRRYMNLAGSQARAIAVERVSTLELMAGVDNEAQQAAHELGETTKPVATPTAKIERQLVTEARDGSRVPINSEKDLERLRKQGVPQTAPSPAVPTPVPAFVIPAELTARRTPAPTPTPAPPRQAVNTPAPTTQTSVYAKATPHPPDEDALMASAFTKGTNKSDLSDKSEVPDASHPSDPSDTSPPTPRPSQATPPPTMAFTKKAPAYDSPRAAAFFNVAQVAGPQAQIALVNDLPNAVVTLSLTPEDNGEVISAILVPGEKRTLLIKPARYDLNAAASTNDYSPITLMNTHFKYTFDAGRQYTRRFNKTSLEQVN